MRKTLLRKANNMLTFEHANAVCSGSQLIIDIESADDGSFGFVTMTLRRQTAAPSYDSRGRKKYATFGDDTDISVKMSVKQIVHVLTVLEGKAENVLGGKGLFVNDELSAVVVHADMVREKPSGYAIHFIARKSEGTLVSYDQRILLNPCEALIIVKAINAVFGLLAFGE